MSAELIGLDAPRGEAHASATTDRLFELHAPMAGRLAYLLTGDRQLAEDLAQEAFVRLLVRFRFIRDEAAIPLYLRRCVTNLVRKHWRKLGTERRYLRMHALPGEDLEPQSDLELRDELWEALGRLPFRQRAAIVLRFWEDLSEQATARILGCPVGSVKSAVSRGLRRMREEISDDERDRT